MVHVIDASRAVPLTTTLLNDEGKADFIAQHDAEYDAVRKAHSAPPQPVVPIEQARARRTPIEWRAEDIATPEFFGVRVLRDFPLATLREFIDWSPLFHAWGLKGIYPRIFEDERQGTQARHIFADANTLLDRIVSEKLIAAHGVYGFFPANALGDDVALYTDATRAHVLDRLYFLRQQANREGSEPCRSLSDFIAPKDTGLPDSRRCLRGHQRHRPQGGVR